MVLRKGLYLAACCSVCFFFFLSSTSKAQPFGISPQPPQAGSQRNTLGCATGRFVFGQVSDSSKDQFMLDTETGRLWRIAESGKIGTHLKPVPYCDEKGECSPLPIQQQKAP